MRNYDYWKEVKKDQENIVYLEKKNNNQKNDFKSFLLDLSLLIKKYI